MPVLKKLVALKRQKAEQLVLSLQQDMKRIETEILKLTSRLQSMDRSELKCDVRIIARQQGHVEKVIADIAALKSNKVTVETEWNIAREALKRVFHSADQLEQLSQK